MFDLWRPTSDKKLAKQQVQQARDEEPLGRVIGSFALFLESFTRQAQVVRETEDAVQHADLIARRVLGLACANRGGFEPMVDLRHDAASKRPLDVAEKDQSRDVR